MRRDYLVPFFPSIHKLVLLVLILSPFTVLIASALSLFLFFLCPFPVFNSPCVLLSSFLFVFSSLRIFFSSFRFSSHYFHLSFLFAFSSLFFFSFSSFSFVSRPPILSSCCFKERILNADKVRKVITI